MKPWRNKLFLLGGVAILGLASAAYTQNAQEQILPPGFENAAPVPPEEQTPAQEPGATPGQTQPGTSGGGVRRTPQAQASSLDDLLLGASDEELAELLEGIPPPIEIPDFARRPTDVVGALDAGNWGLGQGAFGGANGRFLSTLMRRTDAPLPSRWGTILLRRALLSRVPAPSYVHPVDWVAERAWLLLRMGEADGARMLVQAVDVDQFTPKMFSVAVQTALATADPAALCPLVEPGRETSDEPIWPLADSICAALEGNASRAGEQIDLARRRGTVGGADLLLTEKVIGAGADTRRAVTVEWEDIDSLNTYRFGLAAATGAEIPGRLLVSPQMRAWHARAPMVPLEQRTASAEAAAALGVFSNASLVEMYSLLADTTDVTELNQSVGGRLRTAYAARDANARLDAIRGLWDEAGNPEGRYARQILTAVAASRIEPSAELGGAIPNLIASMLSAGMDREAARWSDAVGDMDNGGARDRALALLAVGLAEPEGISTGMIGSFEDNDDSPGNYKSKLLVAALAGLGRISEGQGESLAGDMDFTLEGESRWSRMLDAAARSRQQGTVALLAAAGMQTPTWRGVPPAHFYRIIRAMRAAGLEYEARMMAAEALSRA